MIGQTLGAVTTGVKKSGSKGDNYSTVILQTFAELCNRNYFVPFLLTDNLCFFEMHFISNSFCTWF